MLPKQTLLGYIRDKRCAPYYLKSSDGMLLLFLFVLYPYLFIFLSVPNYCHHDYVCLEHCGWLRRGPTGLITEWKKN